MSKKHIERALITNDANGNGVVLATDGVAISFLCSEVCTNVEEIGLDQPDGPGLFLWEGYCQSEAVNYEYQSERELVWYGSLRPVKIEEIEELFKMEPPEPIGEYDGCNE